MTTPSAAGERFIASSDDKAVLIIEVGKIIREKRPQNAKKVPTMSVPNIAVRVLSWFDPPLKQILPILGNDSSCSNEKAKKQLGWKPRSMEESVLATADSLVKFGIV
jgi:nucleoside-diphosphate-sugar epimerase